MNKKITLAPFAAASDGTVYANVAHFQSDVAVMKIIQQARRLDGVLFIGVAVTHQEKKLLARALDHAGTVIVVRKTDGYSAARVVGTLEEEVADRHLLGVEGLPKRGAAPTLL